jgi:hypothetical protein
MKPATTLKKLLKPPFYHENVPGIGFIHDGNTRLMDVPGFSGDEDPKDSHLADIRGWGFFQYFENGEQLQDEFKDIVAKALNEYWEKHYGEPLRWEVCDTNHPERGPLTCPYCGFYGYPDIDDYTKSRGSWEFCPSCGKRVKKLEGLRIKEMI